MKDNLHTAQTGLSESKKKKLIEEGKAQACVSYKKDKRCIMLYNKFIFVNEPPPIYQDIQN